MRIAFVGKGGSGKTTAAALFSRHLAESGHRVLAVMPTSTSTSGRPSATTGRGRVRPAATCAG